jgi:DNA-binding transcriptional ArsR family regulator
MARRVLPGKSRKHTGYRDRAANRHLDALVEAGVLEEEGATRSREYRLRRTSLLNRELRVTPVLNADRLGDDHIAPVLAADRAGVRDLCRGAFGELIRNVIAHAQAQWITVAFAATARHLDITVERRRPRNFQPHRATRRPRRRA